jgi:putative ABC transport system permease protein
MRSDLVAAFRSLKRDRAFTAFALILFALTGGVTATAYAVIDAVVLRPMNFAQQNLTAVAWARDMDRNPVVELALGEVDAWRRQSTSFSNVGVFGSANLPVTVVAGESRLRASLSLVSAPFFDVIGIQPQLGRTFGAEDEVGNEARVALISHTLWATHFNSEPAVIGTVVRVERRIGAPQQLVEIVGVMPAGFDFPRGVELWMPAHPFIRTVAQANAADVNWYLGNFKMFFAIGRLNPHVSSVVAQHELTTLIDQNPAAGAAGPRSEIVVTPVDDYLIGATKPLLWTMLAGGFVMIFFACSSVGGLHLFRLAKHNGAFAMQLALGASRGRLVRRSLLENALLGLFGAVGMLLVSWFLTRIVVANTPVDIPRIASVNVLTGPVVVLLGLIALTTAALSGLWPVLFIGRVDAGDALAAGSRTAMGPRERLLQRLLVGWQLAVAVVLLAGAGLFVRTVQNLDQVPLGFNTQKLISVDLQPSGSALAQWDQFFQELRSRIEALPQVEHTGAVALRPLSGPVGNDTIPVLEGQEGLGPDAPWRTNARANLQSVTPGYFQTLGTKLLSGRDFLDSDQADVTNVAIVSASAAKQYWPGRDAVGRPILVATQRAPGSREKPRWLTVVGVVEDIRYRGIMDQRLDIYLPAAQSTIRVRHLLIRASGSVQALLSDVPSIARSIDPGVIVGDVSLMTDIVSRETAPWRFAMKVLSLFGIVAAVLSVAGLVGLVSLAVTLRRRELGIRSALGASPKRLRQDVLMETFGIAAISTGVGIAVFLAVGHFLERSLVGTSPRDWVSISGAAMLTLLSGLLASLVPARRAAAANPVEVLRG